MEESGAIRVLVVDDHYVVREGIRAVLENRTDISLVGEAGSGREALEMVQTHSPQVVLLDLGLPDLHGVQVVRELAERHPEVRAVILTMYDQESHFVDAMRAGASGYLLKDARKEQICEAILAAAQGSSIVQGDLIARALTGNHEPESMSRPSGEETLAEPLTEREIEILQLIADGHANKEVADRLHLAESTIKKYVQRVMAKLDAADRTEAAVRALRLGLVH